MPTCYFCLYQSTDKIEELKHLFQAYNFENNFNNVCEISSCTCTFTKGSSFDVFRSHCARYHHNWRELLSESYIENDMDTTCTGVPVSEDQSIADCSELMEGTFDQDFDESRMLTDFNSDHVVSRVDTVKKAAVNLVLTLKEKFKLSQSSIDYTIKVVEELTMLSTNTVKQSVMNNLHASGFTMNPSFDACFLQIVHL